MSIRQNITNLQNLLEQVNALPEASSGGVTLPELSNPASTADLRADKELIDADGNVIIGTMTDNGEITTTMDGIDVKSVTVPAGYTSGGTVSLDNTIDNEVDTQADLIAQIMTVLESKTGFNTIYVGSSVPSNDFGINGDIYVVRGSV